METLTDAPPSTRTDARNPPNSGQSRTLVLPHNTNPGGHHDYLRRPQFHGFDAHWLLRFGAVAGVIFGFSLGIPGVIEAFTGETASTSFIVAVGTAGFGLPALLAYYLHHADVAGRFGKIAYAVNTIGLGLFAARSFAFNLVLFFLDEAVSDAVQAEPATMWAISIGGVTFIVGTILFGVSMARSGVMPRAAAVGYSVSLALLAVFGMLDDSLISSLNHVVAALSLTALSARVWRGTTASPKATSARVPDLAPAA